MKSHLLAGLAGLSLIALAGPALAAPTLPAATAPKPQMIPGLGVVNSEEVVAASSAFKAANQERQATYKAQIDAAQARQTQINAQIQPLIEKFNRDRQGGTVAQAALQQQAQSIQNMQQAGQRELQTMLAPVLLSQTFVREQIAAVINQAISNAMAKKGVTFVVPLQNGMFYNNTGSYDLNPTVVAELDALLPKARVVPPDGWQPGQAIPAAQ